MALAAVTPLLAVCALGLTATNPGGGPAPAVTPTKDCHSRSGGTNTCAGG